MSKTSQMAYLIADMVQGGATEEEIIRAVKYSMAIIDLDQCEKRCDVIRRDMNIPDLVLKYSRGGRNRND